MNKHLILGLGLCTVVLFSACKSRESAYRAAYEKAKAQEELAQETQAVQEPSVPVAVPTAPKTEEVVMTPVTPATPAAPVVKEDHSDVRTIDGEVTVISGSTLKTYSVVVGSFLTQANAEGEMNKYKEKGYNARVLKTSETINGQTGWFRVIADSFDDKPTAAQLRDELRATCPGAWLLYNK